MSSHNFSQKTNVGFLTSKFTTSRLIQKESLSSFCKKIDSLLYYLEVVNFQGRNPTFVFWEKLWLDNLVLRLTDLYRQPCINTVPLNFLTVRRSCPANHFYNHHKSIWRRLEASLRAFVAKKVILPENSETLYKKLSDLVVESKYLAPSVLDIFSWFIPCLTFVTSIHQIIFTNPRIFFYQNLVLWLF